MADQANINLFDLTLQLNLALWQKMPTQQNGDAFFSDVTEANNVYICYVGEEGWGIFHFAVVDGLIRLVRAYGEVTPQTVLPEAVLNTGQGLTTDDFLDAFQPKRTL